MIIDPNEFIEDNLLHNNSSADVNCTEWERESSQIIC